MSDPVKEWSEFLKIGDPFDLESFGWGLLAGGLITVAIGGVTLYFTWPYLIGVIKGFASAKEIREVLGV